MQLPDLNSLVVQAQMKEIREALSDTDNYLLAPNGQPSQLTEEQWLLTRTEAFKEWYGDWTDPNTPAIRDTNGEPKVLYHGTPYGGFNEFKAGKSFYFSENLNYAQRYQNQSASSIRSYRGNETYPEVKAVFLRASDIFDTREDYVRDIHDEQFFGQFGDATELSERGLLDWTQADDALEFIEENELDFNVIAVDEGGDPANNDVGFNWRGVSYVSKSGEQALTLTKQFIPEQLKELSYKTEIFKQIHETLQQHQDTPDFMRDRYGRPTKLNQDEWVILRTPFVQNFRPWGAHIVGAHAEPRIEYAYASMETTSLEFTQSLSDMPYVRIGADRAEIEQDNHNAYPLLLKNTARRFNVREKELLALQSDLIDDALDKTVVGLDKEIVVALAKTHDKTIGLHLEYIRRYGLEKGGDMWRERHASEVSEEYFNPQSSKYLNRFSTSLLGELNKESLVVLKDLGFSDEDLAICTEMGYNKPLTISNLTRDGETIDEVFALLKDNGFDTISDDFGSTYILNTSSDFVRTLQNPDISFQDIGTVYVEDSIREQRRENETKVLRSEVEALKEQLQGSEGYMLAPNGKRTNLTEEQWLQIQTPQFKQWFGDYTDEAQKQAMLLDANGEPMIFFHGTPDSTGIVNTGNIFNPDMPANMQQAWFTPDKAVARTYSNKPVADIRTAQPDILPVYLKFNNPLIINGRRRLWREAQYNDDGEHVLNVARQPDANGNAYDGIIINNVYDDYNSNKSKGRAELGTLTTTYVSFDRTNIKSATLNNGAFSELDDDIRYSKIDYDALDEEYIALAKRYIDGDTSVESELRDMVDAQAKRNGYLDGYDYRISHEAPHNNEDDKPIYDLAELYGDDIYTDKALQYFPATTDKDLDKEAIDIIQSLRGDEEATLKIYRAVPIGAPDTINAGDWVAITKGYADQHGVSNIIGEYKIIEQEVLASQVYTDANSIQEWGFDDGQMMYRSEKDDTKRLSALVTFDDDGDIIPLSKRFDDKSDDIRYSFIGAKAKTIDQVIYNKAAEDLANGVSPEEVRKETGWELGADGKMRLHLQSDSAEIRPIGGFKSFKSHNHQIKDILKHDDLFNAYPQIADYSVELRRMAGKKFGEAQLSSKDNAVRIFYEHPTQISNPTEEEKELLLNTVIHEAQHIIQRIEGFAVGASASHKKAMTNKEFYSQTGVFEYLELERQKLIDSNPTYKKVYEEREEYKLSLAHKYGLKETSEDLMMQVYDNANDEEVDRLFDYTERLDSFDADFINKIDEIDNKKWFYLSETEIVTPLEQYLHSAGEVEARKAEPRSNIKSIEKEYPSYLQVVEFDNEHKLAARVSTSQPSMQDQKVDMVRKTIADYLGVDTLRKLESQGKLIIQKDYKIKDVEGFYKNGQATLIASNLREDTVIPTLLHELGGHAGFQKLLKPKQYGRLMAQFNSLVDKRDVNALKAKSLAERDEKNKHDEYLPYYLTISAKQKNDSLVKNTISAVKAWAFDRFGVPLKMNANDMVVLSKRMIKRLSSPEISLAKEGVKLESRKSNITEARVVRKAQKLDTMNNIEGRDKPDAAPDEFISQKSDILYVSPVKANQFKKGVAKLLRDDVEDNESYDFEIPKALTALDGYLHKDNEKKPYGGSVRCNIRDTLPLRFSGWVSKKIRGLMSGWQNDCHASTKATIEDLYEQLNNPVAILRSNSSDGYIVLTENESMGRPLVVAVQTDKTHKEESFHYICSAFGREDAQNWIEHEAKIGRLLYFNDKKNAVKIDNQKLNGVISRLSKNYQPLTPNGLRLRYLDSESNKMKESLEDALTHDNAIQSVFTTALSNGIVMTDDEIRRSFYSSVIPQSADTAVQVDLIEGTINIGNKDFEMADYKVAPVPEDKMNDFQYRKERDVSLKNKLSMQRRLRMMARNNDVEKLSYEVDKTLSNQKRGAEYGEHALNRFTDMTYTEKLSHFEEAVRVNEERLQEVVERKRAADFDSIMKYNEDGVHKRAGVLAKQGLSVYEARTQARQQVEDPNSKNQFLSRNLVPFNEYGDLLAQTVTPLPSGYKSYYPHKPNLDGYDQNDDLSKLSREYASQNFHINKLKSLAGFTPKDNSPISQKRILVRTFNLDNSGRKQQYGAAILSDGKVLSNENGLEHASGTFAIINNQNYLLTDSKVASELDNIVVAASLHDAIGFARHLKQKGELNSTLVVSALSEDNLQEVATKFASRNERGKINIISSDADNARNIAASLSRSDNTSVLPPPDKKSWGELYTSTASKKGFSAASVKFDAHIDAAQRKSVEFKAVKKEQSLPMKSPQELLREIKATEGFRKQQELDLRQEANKQNQNRPHPNM